MNANQCYTISMHILISRSLLPHKNNDKGDFLALHLKEIDLTVNHSAKTKAIIVGICMCSLRTADVSPRSSPLRGRFARRNVCRSQAIACVAFKTSLSSGHQRKLGSVTALTLKTLI